MNGSASEDGVEEATCHGQELVGAPDPLGSASAGTLAYTLKSGNSTESQVNLWKAFAFMDAPMSRSSSLSSSSLTENDFPGNLVVGTAAEYYCVFQRTEEVYAAADDYK